MKRDIEKLLISNEVTNKLPPSIREWWPKFAQRIIETPSSLEAFLNWLSNPSDLDSQAAFRLSLRKLFEKDPAFVAELDIFVSSTSQSVANQILIGRDVHGDIVSGDKIIGVNQAVTNIQTAVGDSNVVITGDANTVIVRLPEVSPSDLRRAYLNWVFEQVATLSLSGIDPKVVDFPITRLSLSSTYVALATLEIKDLGKSSQRKEILDLPVERKHRYVSALDQLNRHPRLVLLGDPGSGKSTFINFVAMCLTGEALRRNDANLDLLTAPFPGEEEDRSQRQRSKSWEHGDLLPIRIILRDFAAVGLPSSGQEASGQHLWGFLSNELRSASLGDYEPFLRTELREKGALILLDGLDEVPEASARRIQIKQAIESFVASFPLCRILVTSRTYAYQKQEWRLNSFTESVLAPFSNAQIKQFIDRWYHYVGLTRSLDPEDAQGRAEVLKRAIVNNDRLLGLAERPLLLTLMASLHAWRGGSLPVKREELYADSVDLLLDWWENKNVVRDHRGQIILMQPSLAEWLKVDRQEVRHLLEELAYKVHATQPDLLGTGDIKEVDLVAGLMRISQSPDIRPSRLVEYLTSRAGLLLPRGIGIYTFAHRTFQEYLAACYLTDHDYPDQIAELASIDPQRWREVTLLAGAKAGRGSASAVWTLVDALCFNTPTQLAEQSVEKIQQAMWGAFLAGQALTELANLPNVSERNRPKLIRVQNWLLFILQSGQFPAHERANVGNTLAQLGDIRFREDYWYLPDEPAVGFIHIPSGPFWMGNSKQKDTYSHNDEHPQHLVILPDYFIARFPVTEAQFQSFISDSGYSTNRYWSEASKEGYWKDGKITRGSLALSERLKPESFGYEYSLPNHPVIGVSWYEALAYCRWLEEKLRSFATSDRLTDKNSTFWLAIAEGKLTLTLPSEAEWEKASRGGSVSTSKRDVRLYPWGDEFDLTRANTRESGIGMTSAVGCFPGGASPFGVLDMSGNIFEWTRSIWGPDSNQPQFNYPYDPNDGRENLSAPQNILRSIRGGAYNTSGSVARCTFRGAYPPYTTLSNVGFRVILRYNS